VIETLFQGLDDLMPITGPLKEVIVLCEVVIIFLSFQLGIIILLRHLPELRRLRTSPLDIFMAILFFAWGTMWIFFILGSQIAPTLEERAIFSTYGYFSLAIGSIFYVYYMEQHLVRKPGILTAIFLALVTFMIIWYSFHHGNDPTINLPIWGLFIFIFLAYVIKNRDYITINKSIILFIAGGFGLMIGFVGTMDIFMELTQSYVLRLIGEGFQIFSLILLTLFFSKVTSFSEFDWQKSIQHVFLEFVGGISIFSHNFKSSQEEFNKTRAFLSKVKISSRVNMIQKNRKIVEKKEILEKSDGHDSNRTTNNDIEKYRQEFSGVAIYTIKQFLQEVANKESEEISSFRSDDSFITIEYGKHIIGIVVSDKKLSSIESLLRRFIDTVETVYSDILPKWGGDLEKISSVNDIFKSIFEIKKR
jgi:hypothetical protein